MRTEEIADSEKAWLFGAGLFFFCHHQVGSTFEVEPT